MADALRSMDFFEMWDMFNVVILMTAVTLLLVVHITYKSLSRNDDESENQYESKQETNHKNIKDM